MTLSFEPPALTTALPPRKWWTYLHADPEAVVRLWCFPCIGAGAAFWRPWSAALSGAAELVSVCLPGREARLGEAPYTNLDDLAASCADAMAPFLDGRDVLCGHGFGALLAASVARQLRQGQAQSPRALVVSAAPAPHLRWPGPTLHRMSPGDFIAAVERYYGPIPDEFREHPEFLELLLPALRADLEALETYRITDVQPFDFPILALAGRSDPLVPTAAVTAWRAHTRGRFERDELEGGHFFVAERPTMVAARVRTFLARL